MSRSLRRGELYRVHSPGGGDPRRSRVFVVVSRQVLLDSYYSTAICAPVFSKYDGLSTQVPLGVDDGLKRDCAVHCDQLTSVLKSNLTDFVSALSPTKRSQLDEAMLVALAIAADPAVLAT